MSPEDVLQPVPGFVFEPIPASLDRQIKARFGAMFARLQPTIEVRRVSRADGASTAIRIVAVSYLLPEGAPFEAVATEIGREFLRATPANARPALNGNGVYIKERGDPTETVAFFVGENLFVYVYGATVEAATEEVARLVYRAACRTLSCARSGIRG